MTHSLSKHDWVAVIPAAGVGSRMQAQQPKQYLPLAGQTVLEHSIQAVAADPRVALIIVALSPGDPYFSELSPQVNVPVMTVDGGAERADSVLAGLNQAHALGAEHVLVHDAARPCLHASDLRALLNEVEQQGDAAHGAILAAPVADTMKRGSNENYVESTVSREQLWHAYTPQAFPLALLRNALQHALDNGLSVTDEASAIELQDGQPKLVSGRRDNLKITHPGDLQLAAFFLQQQAQGANECE